MFVNLQSSSGLMVGDGFVGHNFDKIGITFGEIKVSVTDNWCSADRFVIVLLN